MKCVAIGDVFISPETMKKAIDQYPDVAHDTRYFFFGHDNRKDMRDVVKQIERYERDRIAIPDGVMNDLTDAEMLMVHLCPVTRAMIDHAPKLKYVLCNRGGVENVDVDAATERGIVLLHNPAHNSNAVAEFTIGLMFSEMRNIARANLALKHGIWREKFPNTGRIIELKDLTVGIVGFGNVGELVCEKLNGFRCRVLVFDPRALKRENPAINWDKVSFVGFDELVSQSDIITLHARFDKIIFGAREFAMMKKSAYFINTSRPCMVDYAALADALKNQEIGGAAIDVFDKEPIGNDHPFVDLDNVTLTNHRGGDTLNSYDDSPLAMMQDWEKIMAGKTPRFWYNRTTR